VLTELKRGNALLADVLPSAVAALGGPGPNALDLPAADPIVVVVVDGLGWSALRDNADVAPFLASRTGRPIPAGFPTTTATSLASIGTGVPPAVHGMIGYTTLIPDVLTEPIAWLHWRGARSGNDLSAVAPPEDLQPLPTVFERAAAAGIATRVVAAPALRTSALTRAILRGADYAGASTLADLAWAATRGGARLTYAYIDQQDLMGHKYGPSTEPWRMQLALIDRALEMLAARLPPGGALVVTADHGMVDVPNEAKVDYDAEPDLRQDVTTLTGEGRARFVHIGGQRVDDVIMRWRDRLGDRVRILRTDELIATGWLGPEPPAPPIRARLGDLTVVSLDQTTIVRRRAERYLAQMRGQHGARTDAELLVPLLAHVA
jgi:hypothetical protein